MSDDVIWMNQRLYSKGISSVSGVRQGRRSTGKSKVKDPKEEEANQFKLTAD